jgi:hypothetical protein
MNRSRTITRGVCTPGFTFGSTSVPSGGHAQGQTEDWHRDPLPAIERAKQLPGGKVLIDPVELERLLELARLAV